MITQNVLHRPVRTLITIIGVAVEVMLVILVVGLTTGLLQEYAKRTGGVGADVMVQPPSASMFISFSGAPMPISIAGKLEQLDYVQAVAPVLVHSIRSRRSKTFSGSLRKVSARFRADSFFMRAVIFRRRMTFWWTTFTLKAKQIKVGQTLHHPRARFPCGWNCRAREVRPAICPDFHATGNDRARTTRRQSSSSSATVPTMHAAVQDEVKHLLPGYEIRLPKELMSHDDVFERARFWARS